MSLPEILTGSTALDRSTLRCLPTPAFCTRAASALFGEVNATSLIMRMAQYPDERIIRGVNFLLDYKHIEPSRGFSPWHKGGGFILIRAKPGPAGPDGLQPGR